MGSAAAPGFLARKISRFIHGRTGAKLSGELDFYSAL
jgi:hypothetical protein